MDTLQGSVISPKKDILQNRSFLLLVIILAQVVITIGVFWYFNKYFFSSKAKPVVSTKSIIDESKLPISLSLLTNPIVYEWRGGVIGKLTQKNEDDFTLVDDKGNSITITNTMPGGGKWKVIFFDKANNYKEASYSAIPIGSTLRGDFFLFKNGPNHPVGSSFTKE